MRYMILLILISALATLTGCSDPKKAENAVDAMGRYVEEEISLPEDFSEGTLIGFHTEEDGALILYGIQDKQIKKLERNKEGWAEENLDWMNGFLEKGKELEIEQYLKGEDGKEYALAGDYSEEFGKSRIFCYDGKEGKELKIPALDEFSEVIPDMMVKPSLSAIAVTKDGTIYGEDRYEADRGIRFLPEKWKKESFDLLPNYIVWENEIAGIKPDYNKIGIRTEDGKYEYIDGPGDLTNAMIGKQSGNYFVLSTDGIYRKEQGGTIWQKVVDGDWTSISNPGLNIKGFAAANPNKEEYYIIGSINEKPVVYRYYFDETVSAVAKEEITVFSLYENPTVRQAISLFHKENPNTKVNYQIARNKDSSETLSESIRALNTQLLAGQGPDLILLDGLPEKQYLEKEVLKDITSVAEEINQGDGLVQNIVDGCKIQGKQYAIPIRFEVPVAYGKKEVVECLSDIGKLAQYAEENPKEVILPPTTAGDFVQTCYVLNSNQLLGEKDAIEEESCRDFLLDIKTVSEHMDLDEAVQAVLNYYVEQYKGNTIKLGMAYDAKMPQLIDSQYSGSITQLGTLQNAALPFYAIRNGNLSYSNINQSYFANGKIGINASSPNQELAERFVKTILSEEVQNYVLSDGFPVNRKALDYLFSNEANAGIEVAFAVMTTDNILINVPPLTSEERDALMAVIHQLTTPISNDPIVGEMITEEAVKFITEDKTGEEAAADAAREIVRKVNLYLSEQ